MGNLYETNYLKEIEKDRIKKLRKYYKKSLIDLGLNFDFLSLEQQKKILDFFQEMSESEETNSQIINSIKKCNLIFLEKILEKLNIDNVDQNSQEVLEIFNIIFPFIINKFELLIQQNGYCSIGEKFIDNTFVLLKFLEKMLENYGEITECQSLVEQLLIDNFLSSWENIYFSRNITPDKRRLFYETFKEFLIEIEYDIRIEIHVKNNHINYKNIIDSFLYLHFMLNEKFINDVEVYFSGNTEGIKNRFEKEIIEITSNNIKFKDLKTQNLKKDNQFNERIENLKKLIHKLDNLNAGTILKETPEFLELLYIIFYKNKDKIKINSVFSKEKNFFTLIKYILEEKDLDERILKVLNKYIRGAIFVATKKEEELGYILELEKLLEKLFRTVNSGTLPENIYKNLKMVICLYSDRLEFLKTIFKD